MRTNNRNILRLRDQEQRCQMLKIGRLPVVTFLTQLPATQHDPQSLCVDLTFKSNNLIILTVTGVFKEKTSNEKNFLLRSFQRTLIIVPSGTGFCIRNEMLHINSTTHMQEKKAFKTLAQTTAPPVSAPVVQPVNQPPQPSIPSTSAGVGVDQQTKMQMVQAMAQQSNMNIEWSTKYVIFIISKFYAIRFVVQR